MTNVHLYTNTSEDLPCVNCGGPGNIIRESNVPEDKKLKCQKCSFMYTAADSLEAKNAGVIPDGPPELDNTEPEADSAPGDNQGDLGTPETGWVSTGGHSRHPVTIPLRPSFVLVSKDRTQSEFAGKKDVKSVILRWEYEGRKYNLFELIPKKSSTKVELQ